MTKEELGAIVVVTSILTLFQFLLACYFLWSVAHLAWSNTIGSLLIGLLLELVRRAADREIAKAEASKQNELN